MAATKFSFILLTVVLLNAVTAVSGYFLTCSEIDSCEQCTGTPTWAPGVNCRWCPLNGGSCHTYASDHRYIYGGNTCGTGENINKHRHCPKWRQNDPYDPDLAARLAVMVSVAYMDPSKVLLSDAQSFLDTETTGNMSSKNYKIKYHIVRECLPELSESKCGVVVATSAEESSVIVAFRGTTDISQLMEEVVGAFEETNTFLEGEANNYFFEATDGIYSSVAMKVHELMTSMSSKKVKVYVTGHSLGGAIATLTAARMIEEGRTTPEQLKLYTFGSPRVGDLDFARSVDNLLWTSYRVVREGDIVARIPFQQTSSYFLFYISVFQYSHIQTEVLYRGNVTNSVHYDICSRTAGDRCEYGDWSYNPAEWIDLHDNYFIADMPLYVASRCRNGENAVTEQNGTEIYTATVSTARGSKLRPSTGKPWRSWLSRW